MFDHVIQLILDSRAFSLSSLLSLYTLCLTSFVPEKQISYIEKYMIMYIFFVASASKLISFD
jgi:hypothetical protein